MKRIKVKDEFKQYMARMKSYLAGRDPLQMQAAYPAKLKRAVRGLSKAQLVRRARGRRSGPSRKSSATWPTPRWSTAGDCG